jgi:hypothetical protein
MCTCRLSQAGCEQRCRAPKVQRRGEFEGTERVVIDCGSEIGRAASDGKGKSKHQRLVTQKGLRAAARRQRAAHAVWRAVSARRRLRSKGRALTDGAPADGGEGGHEAGLGDGPGQGTDGRAEGGGEHPGKSRTSAADEGREGERERAGGRREGEDERGTRGRGKSAVRDEHRECSPRSPSCLLLWRGRAIRQLSVSCDGFTRMGRHRKRREDSWEANATST